ncbi:MAG: hypothetical protein EA352_04740 [Gemmatimonadales bacterium]|nr:MAG: hypothetical protein EA352_04740 [Gemmatimonadales bacterium]
MSNAEDPLRDASLTDAELHPERGCLYCSEPLGQGIPQAPVPGRRHAYDPALGRLWEICPRCQRWNPVPLGLRWETLEGWERAVHDRGQTVLTTEHLSLVRVDDGEVVRVGDPPLVEWGGWRYGEALPALPRSRPGFFQRLLGGLPPPPLEGYDPYGMTGPMGGIAGAGGPSRWLGSPFIEKATPLTMAFASVPLAPECPSCGLPVALRPWDLQAVSFVRSEAARAEGVRATRGPEDAGILATCAHCETEVVLPLDAARPTLRLALGILDTDAEARSRGRPAGEALQRVGGGAGLLQGMSELGVPLGDLGRTERVALGIALDARAEAEALEAEWAEAEEIAAIMDGELSEVEGFRAFRERILEEGAPGL